MELLSEQESEASSGMGAILYVLAGSEVAFSVTIPGRDASGRKAPVRMRCRSDSNCLRGSAKIVDLVGFLTSTVMAQHLSHFRSKACFPCPAERSALGAMNGGRIWVFSEGLLQNTQ